MQHFEYDVFISYSRKDYVDENKNVIPENIVSSIKELLDKEQLSYWFDEEGIYSGDEYASLIATAIRTSRIFLFISSENSNASVWTSNEIASAHAYKRKIIPFKIDDSYYDDSVMLYIAKLDFIDYKANPEKGLKKLKKSITEYLHKQKQEEELHNAVEKQKELEDKKREEQEKELADIRKNIDEIAVRITDLKNQLHVQNTLYNSYKEQEATLLGTEYSPKQTEVIEQAYSQKRTFNTEISNNFGMRIWAKVISSDEKYRHPAVSFLLSFSFIFCFLISVGIFVTLSLPEPYQEEYCIAYSILTLIALQLFLIKKWKRIALYVLFLFIIVPSIFFTVYERVFTAFLITLVITVAIIVSLFIKYQGKSYFSQTDNLITCIKDKKGVWKPFGICCFILFISYFFVYVSCLGYNRTENYYNYDNAVDSVACDSVVSDYASLEISDTILSFNGDGGIKNISILSGHDIGILYNLEESIGHVTLCGDTIRVYVKANHSKRERKDYFELEDSIMGYSQRVYIYQYPQF